MTSDWFERSIPALLLWNSSVSWKHHVQIIHLDNRTGEYILSKWYVWAASAAACYTYISLLVFYTIFPFFISFSIFIPFFLNLYFSFFLFIFPPFSPPFPQKFWLFFPELTSKIVLPCRWFNSISINSPWQTQCQVS